MIHELKEIQCTPKNLRSFGLILGGILLALAAAAWWRERPLYLYWLAAGLLIFFARAFYPGVLRLLYKGWMTIAMLIGWVLTRVILAVLFYGVLTPLGIIHRLTGHGILLKKNENQNSYWVKRTLPKTREQYENQF